MRSLCLLAFGCLVGLLLYTYDLKLKTRKLEGSARELVTALQDESDFLALMRAEVSYLSRPERVEEMARKQLRMEPIAPAQLVPWKAVVTGPDSGAQAQTPPAQSDGIAALIEKSAVSSPSPVAK